MLDRIVLCVDDEAILLMAAKHALRSRLGDGYRYETALSAESALELLDECILEGHRVEAVVSDWLMPGMRGDEFLRKVRERHPAMCLILLTGYADRSAVQILERDIGLAAIFQKPCSMAALAGVIKAATTA
jgi:DNA-binding NtrC family response regulator